MTYADLLNALNNSFTPEQLKQSVTVYAFDLDEFLPVVGIEESDSSNDVLDLNHKFLVV